MRIETTRSALAVRLRHAVAFHRDRADLLARILPLVTAALDEGRPVVTALHPDTEERLTAKVGAESLVMYRRPPRPDGGSGQTDATVAARALRELTAGRAGPVTLVAEHQSAFDGADGSYWSELDAAANVALADLPVTLTCFYPELPLHLRILADARRNHPFLLVGGELRHNPAHRGPREVLAAQPAPAPILLGPPDLRHAFSAFQLHEVRVAVEYTLREAGFGADRAEDVVLAVNEVATNAVEHGGGAAELHLWVGSEVVCEIHDRGRLGDPLPGLAAPHPAEPRGRGVWIARQICDVLHVWTDATGTHVRMRVIP